MSKVKTINNLNELNYALRVSEGFMVTVTLKEDDSLQHFMLMKNFPHLDMLKSLKESRELIIRHLENVTLFDDTVSLNEKENIKDAPKVIQEAELIVEDKQEDSNVKDIE